MICRAVAVVVAFGSLATLSACAGDNASRADATVPTAADKGDTVGGGGRLDEIYHQIYTPGNPKWADF